MGAAYREQHQAAVGKPFPDEVVVDETFLEEEVVVDETFLEEEVVVDEPFPEEVVVAVVEKLLEVVGEPFLDVEGEGEGLGRAELVREVVVRALVVLIAERVP